MANVLVGAPMDNKGDGSITAFSGSNGEQLDRKTGALKSKSALGSNVAVADVDGDGYADLITSAPKASKLVDGKTVKGVGSVRVWSGYNGTPIGSSLYGEKAGDGFGTAVAAGDINSDGKADLIIGVPGYDLPPAPPAKTVKDVGKVMLVSGAEM